MALLLLIVSCTSAVTEDKEEVVEEETVTEEENEPDTVTPSPATAPGWMDIELTDVATGQTFKVSDFRG